MPIPPVAAIAFGVGIYRLANFISEEQQKARIKARIENNSPVSKVDPGVLCPGCERPMRKVCFNQVEIDECPFCAGQWFDTGEMEAIHAMEVIPQRFLRVFPIDGMQTRGPGQRDCPRCSKQLMAADVNGVNMDVCTACRGVWLDAGELGQVLDQARGPSGKGNGEIARRSSPR